MLTAQFTLTIVIFAAALALIARMVILERRPRDNLNPSLLPTTPVIIAGGFRGTFGARPFDQSRRRLRANPAKVADFGDKDLLQDIVLARILYGDVIPLRRDAR